MSEGTRKKPPEGWVRWLHDESELWSGEGLISDEQRLKLLERYPDPEGNGTEDRKNSRFIAIISILGSILLGLGVILFFASNWKYINVPFKLGLIFGLITLTYAAGYWLTFEKKVYVGAGKALILLGTLFYGGGIWLVAQIFNINAHYPDGVLYWLAGALLVAFVTRLKPVLALSMILISVWTVMEQSGFREPNYLYIVLMLVVAFPLVYREKSRLSAVLGIISINIWFGMVNLLWQYGENPVFMFGGLLLVSILLYNFSVFQAKFLNAPEFEYDFKIVSLLGSFIALYALSFRGMENSLRDDLSKIYFPYGLIIGYSVLILLCGVVIAINLLKNTRGKTGWYEGIISIFLIAATILYSLSPFIEEGIGFTHMQGFNPFTIVFNIIFFGIIIAVLSLGFKEKEPLYINMALAFFVLDVFTRYFDYMWKLLPRSIFFIIGGLVLIAGGLLLETRRRKIIRDLR